MTGFLRGQIDYALFVYGLGFILVAVPCFLLCRNGKGRFPWSWLGLFAIATGVNEWLALIAYVFSDAPLFSAIRAIVAVVAALFLIQYGVLGIAHGLQRVVHRRSIPPLVSAIATLAIAYVAGIANASRVLMVGGALLGALGFLLSKNPSKSVRRWLSVSAAAMLLFGIARAIMPQAPLAPAIISATPTLLEAVGIYIYLALSGLVMLFAAAAWTHAQASRCAEIGVPRCSVSMKPATWTTATIILLTVMGWLMTQTIDRYSENEGRRFLLSRTMTTVSGINPDRVKGLKGTSEDLKSTDFEVLKKQLQRTHRVNNDCRFVYIMGERNGKIVFLVDAEPENSKDYSPPGQVYEDATPELKNIFRNAEPFVEGPVVDDWGEWVSGLAAIKDPNTNRVLGVLGIDIDAGNWMHTIALYRFLAITITASMCALVLAFSMAWQKSRETVLRIAEIKTRDEKAIRNITSTLGEGVFVLDGQGIITFINPEACRLLGWTEDETIGKHIHQITTFRKADGSELPVTRYPVLNVLELGTAFRVDDHSMLRRDGSGFPVSYVSTPILEDGKIVGSVTAFQDITERKSAEATIKQMAYFDQLTSLPNRMLFHDRLKMALANSGRGEEALAILFLDLDHFKTINDTLGHAIGDQLLQVVSARLTSLLREGDTVARLGGDEFTLLLPRLSSSADAITVAEKVLAALKPAIEINGHELHVTGSIGIAVHPSDGMDADTLLKNADTAMYRAKESGRDTYQLYTKAMNARALERLSLENNLRRALENNEFLVYYQPQVNVENGSFVGVEALARWLHPTEGLIQPNKFIQIAEEMGLILPMGERILRKACEQGVAWREAGLPPVRFSVNLSMRQFHQQDVVSMISKGLHESGFEPHMLELEITESVAMRNAKRTIKTLRTLKEMGVRIAIDDFGTGYSSLSHLKRFPIDTLKIANSFMKDVGINAESSAIAATIIVLGRSLGLNTIAEGVEREEQLAFLKMHRCNEAQGFLFGRPEPADHVAEALEAQAARAGIRLA